VTSQKESLKRFGDQKAILLVSASTIWIRDGFVPNNTTGYIGRQEFASPRPLPLNFRISYCNLVYLYIFSVIFC
jgi:hypothetical protein